jgi:hypothetical protein
LRDGGTKSKLPKHGAASGAFQAIIALMPPDSAYVEPFAGSRVVLLRKPATARLQQH